MFDMAADLPEVEPTEADLQALQTLSWQQSQDHLEDLVLTTHRRDQAIPRVAVFGRRVRPTAGCWQVAA